LLAERRGIFAGAIPITAFERLSHLVRDQSDDVVVEVAFGKEGKRAVVSGNIKTTLQIECQSCLEPLQWPVDINFKLGVVSSLQEADRLEIEAEPLLFNGEKISLYALLEDEILLSLPDYPKHGFNCVKRSSSKTSDYDEQKKQPKADNPFSVLAKLKNTGE
jgi:uncharacterized protein